MNNFLSKFNFKLSGVHYFQSLLKQLAINKILSSKEIEKIQYEMVEILSENVSYYNKGESDSIIIEVAEKLMLSIYYTIGSYLKTVDNIDEEIELVKNLDIKSLYKKGEEVIKEKINDSLKILKEINENKLKIDNYAYIDTIEYGIPPFFVEYDSRFFSHETPGSIDYPIYIDDMDLVGIEYIYDYLHKIKIENTFCRYFNLEDIEAILLGYEKRYKDLLINIYERVLCNAIAAKLVRNNLKSLNISLFELEFLQKELSDLSINELTKRFLLVGESICEELKITDCELIQYIKESIKKISELVKMNMEIDKLNKVFIPYGYNDEDIIKFEDGKKLDDDKFRIISEEIRSCESVVDKYNIIRKEIHTVYDLLDILEADCIFNKEFRYVFNNLSEIEIALLIKYIPNLEFDDYSKEWKKEMICYINELHESEKSRILEICNRIEII